MVKLFAGEGVFKIKIVKRFLGRLRVCCCGEIDGSDCSGIG